MSHSGTNAKTFSWDVDQIRERTNEIHEDSIVNQIRERTNEIHEDSIVNHISRCVRCSRPVDVQCAEWKFYSIPFSNKQKRIEACRRRAIQKTKPYKHFDCNICGEATLLSDVDEHMKNCEEKKRANIEIDRLRNVYYGYEE